MGHHGEQVKLAGWYGLKSRNIEYLIDANFKQGPLGQEDDKNVTTTTYF